MGVHGIPQPKCRMTRIEMGLWTGIEVAEPILITATRHFPLTGDRWR